MMAKDGSHTLLLQKLVELDISHNSIIDAGISELAIVLSKLQRFKVLNLSHNPIQRVSFSFLVGQLRQKGLSELYFAANPDAKVSYMFTGDVLKDFSLLRKLDLKRHGH